MEENQVTANERITTLTGEILLFSVLGKIIYNEPDCSWIDELTREDIFSDAPFGEEKEEIQRGLQIMKEWANAHVSGISKIDQTQLQADYTALFLGPGKMAASLWESVYFTEERLIFQERTLDVRKWYHQFGLEPERLYQEPDDHISFELFFIAHLARLALIALEENDEATYENHILAQKKFCEAHLLQWGTIWANLVIENAKTDFYQGVGWLTLGALLTIADKLAIKISTETVS